MVFHEKSAWLMLCVLAVTSISYAYSVNELSVQLGQLAPPLLPSVIVFTVLLVVMSIIGHIVIALLKPSEASDKVDERDRVILERAGHWSSYVLGAGVILGLGTYLLGYGGDLMFYVVFGSLVLSQIVEYILQITFYRIAA